MTTLRHQTINSGNLSSEVKVNKHFETSAPLSTSGDSKSVVDFSKQDQGITFDIPPADAEPTETTEASPQVTREERRATFKHAANVERRAMQMQKEAEHSLNQTKQVQQFLSLIDTDPVSAIKALGKDPNNILTKFQNGMFSIPNEPEAAKVESVEEKISRYESERAKEKEENFKFQSNQIKSSYINTKILPIILAEPENFEILNMNGQETCAQFIYDMMDAHYRSTGEELNPRDVAEEMENQLLKEFEDKIVITKKVNKLKKHFRDDTEARGDDLEIPEQLGQGIQQRQSAIINQAAAPQLGGGPNTLTDTKTSQGPSQSRVMRPAATPSPSVLLGADAQANSYQRQTSVYQKKQQRLAKIEEYARVNDIKRNI